MNRLQLSLTRSFGIVLAAVFLYVSVLCAFEGSVFLKLSPLVVILGAALLLVGCITLYLAGSRSSFKRPKLAEIVFLLSGFSVYLALQIYFAGELMTTLGASWDFGLVASAAARAAAEGSTAFEVLSNYFLMWPNNIPLYLLLTGIFKAAQTIGISDFAAVGTAINILSIDLSIYITYLTVKKITGARAAGLVAVVMSFLTLPLLSYVAIFYTDTLTLIFPVLSLYLWTCAKEHSERHNRNRFLFLLALSVVSGVVGTLLKFSVCFVLIAIIIDAAVSCKLMRALKILAAVILLFCAIYFPVKAVLFSSPLLPEKASNDSYIPKLHWVMMGLHGRGDYYDPDYRLTLSVPGDERDAVVKAEIRRRIEDFGFSGMLSHLHEKCSFVWGDGTYYSALKLERDRVHESALDRYLIYYNDRFYISAYACQFPFLLMTIGIAASGLLIFLRRKMSGKILPFSVSVFGMFLFMCIWEARSRYLLDFIPIFITIFCTCVVSLSESLRNRHNKSLKTAAS